MAARIHVGINGDADNFLSNIIVIHSRTDTFRLTMRYPEVKGIVIGTPSHWVPVFTVVPVPRISYNKQFVGKKVCILGGFAIDRMMYQRLFRGQFVNLRSIGESGLLR